MLVQVSQRGKRGLSFDGAEEGGPQLEQEDLMGLPVSQHVSLRVSLTTFCPNLHAWACLHEHANPQDTQVRKKKKNLRRQAS